MGATLDTISVVKKPHKFFKKTIDNDLNSLYEYLIQTNKNILYKNLFNIPKEKLNNLNELNGASTKLGEYYNIFDLKYSDITNLKNAIKDVAIEACQYYEYDFDSQEYLIHGWFNIDSKTENEKISPLYKSQNFHDHASGLGMPYLHGYYCVNAEPSFTFYKINNDKNSIVKNINKNNTILLSETGHPHGRDDWYGDKLRITIAYDLVPKRLLTAHPFMYSWKEI